MPSLGASLTTYYRKKKIRRVYAARLRARLSDPSDVKAYSEGVWRRRFFAAAGALLFAIPLSGVAMRLFGAFHAPEWLDLPVTLAFLVAAVEGADQDWLKRFPAENQSDFLILRGLTGTELDALEDATLLPSETRAGPGRAVGPLWKALGRSGRRFARTLLRYWPATVYAVYSLALANGG
ncbi:MAG: hypothetical protein JST04_03060 [Bdellovibrionales bacterium]|nr:hypothetical protein [Bdellovibrionales bacterium]